MPGSHGKLPAPELPAEHRLALVVATATYTDQSLRQLRAPARDATELGDVLADPDIGGFTVTRVIDQPAQEVRLAVEEFLTDRRPQDLLVVYLSCHGLVDSRRRLYFAATDTRKNRLAATGVGAEWLLDQMEDCRARRQLVILDCCFSGAFAQGAKGDSNLGLGERFHGQGRGRVVLTASRGSEYSFEGEPLAGSAAPTGSVFTSALVAGIRTGAADADNDGFISVDDAYTYAFDSVRAANSNQTPQRWLYGAEGDILLARNPAGITVVPAALPEALRNGLDSAYPAIRLGAVSALGELLQGADPARVLAARIVLQRVAESDIPRVASAARALVESVPLDTGPADASTLAAEAARGDTPVAVDVPVSEATGSVGTSAATLAEPESTELVPPGRWALKVPQGGDAPQKIGGKEAAERETGGVPDETNTAGTGWSGIGRAAAHILRARVVIVGLVMLLVATTATTAILLNKSPEDSAPSSPDPISTVAFSPDGKTLATASHIGTARIWDAARRKQIGQFGDGVFDLAFSPDGKTLATGHGDNTVRLWNVATRKQIRDPLTGHTQANGGSAVRCVAFSPDGKTLASGGVDGTVRLWDLATGKQKGRGLTGHSGEVFAVAFSPDGKVIGSAAGDQISDPSEWTGEVRLWQSTGRFIRELKKQPDAPIALSVAFSPDGKRVAVGFASGAVLWSVATGRTVGDPLPGDGGAVIDLAFSPDGKTIAGGDYQGVHVWNSATGQLLPDPIGHHPSNSQINDVDFSPDGKTLASGDDDGKVRLWNTTTGKPLGQLR